MWRITWKGVVAHRLRYLLTALSVLLGVAFIAGTYVLTDTMNGTFNNLYDQIYQGTGAVVRATQPFNPGITFANQRDRIDARLAGPVAAVPGVRAVALDIEGYAQLVGKNGKPIPDSKSGLFCAYNAGTTIVTLSAGGRSFSMPVTVEAGSVGKPYADRPGAYWVLLGSEVEFRRTDYDFAAAAEAIRRTAIPQRD